MSSIFDAAKNAAKEALSKVGIGDPPEASGFASLKALLFPTGTDLAVKRFVDLGPTPGNVGICLSGGGSRALTAGLGQLRALKFLTTPDGKSLLSQARALSTVSGGSWLGVTYTYLTDTSDDDFLHPYTTPGRLVLNQTAGHSEAETLSQLPKNSIGNAVASRHFGPVQLALQVLMLHKFGRVPTPYLWRTAIGLHILGPQGLFERSRTMTEPSLFSYDAATLTRDVLGPNPSLASVKASLCAAGPTRARRPFLICNGAMFLDQTGTGVDSLAPLQSTPFMTGVVGAPIGTDANGMKVGGGGVTSFAFNSDPGAFDGGQVTLSQMRPLALSDIVGVSSAFFAEVLQNTFAEWRQNTDKAFEEIKEALEDIVDWAEKFLPEPIRDAISRLMTRERIRRMKSNGIEKRLFMTELKAILDEVTDLVPQYVYWPVAGAAPGQKLKASRFADGGNLENTGVASLLAYQDIDNVIAFINSSNPMTAGAMGVIDDKGKEVPGTRVVVSSQVCGLFGYQPYDPKQGYRLYAGATKVDNPIARHNQVFPSSAFPELLKGLWAASGNTGDPASLGATLLKTPAGVNRRPAIFKMKLPVLDNPWFGVQGGRTVGILFVYNNRARDWYDALNPAVQRFLGPFDDPSSCDKFPHYPTVKTHLSEAQINLISSLTAWSVANPGNRQAFIDLFKDGA